jgi:hypothetical protein
MKRFVLALSLLLISACVAAPVNPADISISPQMQSAPDWTAQFPAFYLPVMRCLKTHPVQPAFAGDVAAMPDGRVFVQLQGADNRVYHCIIRPEREKPDHFKLARDTSHRGPAFFPTAWKPETNTCFTAETVSTTDGRNIGRILRGNCPGTPLITVR